MITITFIQLLIAVGGLLIGLGGIYLALRNHIDRIGNERYEEGFRQGHNASDPNGVLLPGEQTSDATLSQHEKTVQLIDSAKKYIKMLVVDGGSWLPEMREALENAKKRGVDVKLLFLDPGSETNKYLCDVEKILTQNAPFNTYVLKAGEQAAQIIRNREFLQDIAAIKYYQSYPAWRGMIVDGKISSYRIIHAPVYGWTALERRTNSPEIIKHFEEHYFDPAWQSGR